MVNRPLKILAIDDNEDNLITMRALMRDFFPDAAVFTVTSGAEGIAIARREDPTVVILDVVMPGMDGFEVCQHFKADEELKDIPIVFITALRGDREHRILALECGAEAFLSKPIDEFELLAQIRAMVKIKNATMEKRREAGRLAQLVEERTAELEKSHLKALQLLESLKISEEKNRRLITQMEQGLAVHAVLIDKKGDPEDFNFLYTNKSFERLTGFRSADILGKTLSEVMPDSKEFMVKKYTEIIRTRESVRYERYFQQFNKYFEVVAYSPQPFQVAVIISDITERKKSEDEIRFLSNHDYLTGLYNRRYYEEALSEIDMAENFPLSLVMADVNGLKLVNDSFGHAVGDEILKKAAGIIRRACQQKDMVARLSGDEFIILMPKTDGKETEEFIRRVKNSVFQEKVGSMNFSVSFGYAIKRKKHENIHEILKNAEDNLNRHKLYESASSKNKTIDLIMNTLYEKSSREMLHSRRVSEICELIAAKMNFEEDGVRKVKAAGLIHDIGKMGIDEKILNKPGGLDRDEWKRMQRHPEIGYRILSSSSEFSELARYVLEHQERWDGNGYPKGLSGEEISIQARIISVADAYDAMTCDRSYRKGLCAKEAVAEIKRCSGTQFDPVVVDVFVKRVVRDFLTGDSW